jgi:molecular chaperone HscB
MLQCASCARPQPPRLVCSECGAPLAADLDFFAALGLPRLLQIDTAALEEAYHDLGRRIHPDRFASASPEIRDASLRATALVTRAYRTLRDPVSRGLYWLELHGHRLAENNKQVPVDLVELVFEVQEQLSQLRTAREEGGASAREGALEVSLKRATLQGLMDELYAELVENFARFDVGASRDADLFTTLKEILSKIAYLKTLVRDVDRELSDTAE